MAERALIFIDKKGVVTYVHIKDINTSPKPEMIAEQLERFSQAGKQIVPIQKWLFPPT